MKLLKIVFFFFCSLDPLFLILKIEVEVFPSKLALLPFFLAILFGQIFVIILVGRLELNKEKIREILTFRSMFSKMARENGTASIKRSL